MCICRYRDLLCFTTFSCSLVSVSLLSLSHSSVSLLASALNIISKEGMEAPASEMPNIAVNPPELSVKIQGNCLANI